MSVSIKNLQRFGEHGWAWDLQIGDYEAEYRTNRNGEGMWRDGRQISGTCQFSLPSGKNAARSKLYREFKDEQVQW